MQRHFKSLNFLVVCTDDSHLHFEVGPDYACGQPRFWARFPSLWSGCRLTHGVLQGRVGFEVRLERRLMTTQLEEQEHMDPYGLRVGWSVAKTSLLLGKDWFIIRFISPFSQENLFKQMHLFWSLWLFLLRSFSFFLPLAFYLSYTR